MSSPQYTRHVGEKFYPDGSARTFPGNTIICFVEPERHASIFDACVWAQEQLRGMSCEHKFGFLPPDSFHMTVIELVCDQVRLPQKWSRYLSLEISLKESDRFFLANVARVPAPTGFRMRYKLTHEPATIQVEAADAETEESLRQYRKQIAEATGVWHPNHNRYTFHISLAYLLIKLTPEEEAEYQATLAKINARLEKTFGIFETSSPQLTFFDDMFKFVPENERHTLTTR